MKVKCNLECQVPYYRKSVTWSERNLFELNEAERKNARYRLVLLRVDRDEHPDLWETLKTTEWHEYRADMEFFLGFAGYSWSCDMASMTIKISNGIIEI